MRRHDLDWLRVLLFALLVLHHTAVGFAPFGASIYGFANDRLGGPLLSLAIYWSHTCRLPTLFLIAGIATWFAAGRGTGPRFVGRRLMRLLLPLLAGSLLLNVPAGEAIERMTGQSRAFLSFPQEWWIPLAPTNVMHLWFLANLALYTVVFWPLYPLRHRVPGPPLMLLAGIAAGTTGIAVLTKPWGQAIAGDGYQLWWYGGFFLGGWAIGAHHRVILGWAARRAYWLVLLGLALFSVEVAMIETARPVSNALAESLAAGGWASDGLAPAYGLRGVGFTVVEGLDAWAWALAALGLCARYLHRDGPLLRMLSPAVFPIYVFHFPITIIGLALLAQVPWPWGLEFLLLAAATYALSGLAYLAIGRRRGIAWLVGGPVSRQATLAAR